MSMSKKMNMNFYHIFIMFTTSFLTQYFIMSWVMDNSIVDFTNSLGKIYLSFLMGLTMVFSQIFMDTNVNLLFYIILFIFILIFIYLYRTQTFIGDKEYLSDMIEHHSMALLTSDQILQKTKNRKIKKLANQIVETQRKEIKEMKDLLVKDPENAMKMP